MKGSIYEVIKSCDNFIFLDMISSVGRNGERATDQIYANYKQSKRWSVLGEFFRPNVSEVGSDQYDEQSGSRGWHWQLSLWLDEPIMDVSNETPRVENDL